MILGDFHFARGCFVEADKLGAPDTANTQSKALIYSAIVAYARPFMTSVREVRLTPAFFAAAVPPFNEALHEYLINLRSKHIAHSVNEFEQCEASVLMVQTPPNGWQLGGGVGVTQTQSIGLSRDQLQQAVLHITNALVVIQAAVDRRGREVYDAFKALFEQSGHWEMAPLARVPNQAKVGKPRAQ